MWTDIYLINSPEQDSNYNHTPYFTSLTAQLNWYASKRVYTIDNANYQRKNNNLKVNYHIDDVALVNYVMVNNGEKWYFYFVMDKVYINERTTELVLRLDVIQTYLFDFQLGYCLLERIHTKRYDSNGNVILEPMYSEEDFSSGEYSPFAATDIYNYKDKGSYIITSSDLLGSGSQGSGGSGGSVIPTSPAISNITEGLFLFAKAKEGFSSVPYDLGDGYLTIGYGVTNQKEEYNSLAPSCTEEQASKVLYNLMLNDYYLPVYNLVVGVRNNPRQCEVEAFADLCYNGGLGAVTSSPMFTKYLNNESLSDCVVGWDSWYITDGSGTTYPGLITRRQQEVQMFLNGVYPHEAIAILGGGTMTDNDGKGYIPHEISGSGEVTEIRQKIVSSAMKLIGLPYVYGGNYPPLGSSEGTDCSGLCQWAYNDAGATNLTTMSGRWTTYTMYANSSAVSFSNALAGDVVFSLFSSPGVPEHVYIIKSIDVENNTMNIVEAQQPGTNILQRTVTYSDTLEIRRLIK